MNYKSLVLIDVEQFRSIFELAPQAIIVSQNGFCLFANKKAVQLFGFSNAEELKGQLINNISPQYSIVSAERTLLRSKGITVTSEFETVCNRVDGLVFPVMISDLDIQLHDGKANVAFITDMTGTKEANLKFGFHNNLLYQMGNLAKVGAWEIDVKTMKQVWSDVTFEIHDVDRKSYDPNVNKEISRFVSGDKLIIEKALEDAIRCGKPYDLELEMITIKGNHKFVHTIADVEIENGKTKKVFGAIWDISEHKHMVDALRASEERFESIFRNVPIPITITRLSDAKVIDLNDAFFNVFVGHTREEVLEHDPISLNMWVYPEDRKKMITEILEKGRSEYFETKFRRKSGELRDVFVMSELIESAGTPYVLEIAQDITESKKLEENLKSLNDQLRAFSHRLQDVREEERLNVSRELHDNVGQALTGLKMDISWMEKKVGESKIKKEVIIERLNIMKNLIDDSINRVRQIASDLRPSILDTLGLLPAIECLFDDIIEKCSIVCSLNSEVRKINLDKQTKLNIYRIIQETLTNIVRHAEATSVKIKVKKQGKNILFEIVDNGKGISKADLNNKTSLGLLGIRERTAQIKGEVNIKGTAGKGTVVSLSIPYGDQND